MWKKSVDETKNLSPMLLTQSVSDWIMSMLDSPIFFLLLEWIEREYKTQLKWNEIKVTHPCPTVCNPMDYSLPGSYLHRILQARILEWVASPFSRVSSWPRNRTGVSCIAGKFFTSWATREAHRYSYVSSVLVAQWLSPVSDSLRPHGLQDARPPCLLPSSKICPGSCLIALVMPPSHLILCWFLLLLPSILPSIRDFSNGSAVCFRWPKYWSFSFSISPSNRYSGLISLKIDWFDLLAVHGNFRSLLEHHSLKASVLWRSAFFMVEHTQSDMTPEKTMTLTIRTFVRGVNASAFQHTV